MDQLRLDVRRDVYAAEVVQTLVVVRGGFDHTASSSRWVTRTRGTQEPPGQPASERPRGRRAARLAATAPRPPERG